MLGIFKRRSTNVYARDKKPVAYKPKRDFEALKEYSHLKPKMWYHPIVKLFSLMTKNYKLMIRSKTSSLIFFFGPLFIIFLVGLGFNTSTLSDISIASYSESYSPLSESLIANLTGGQYNVEKLASEAECIDAVKFQSYHVCVLFPKEMALDNSANNNIVLYVDNSRINIANLISERLASKVSIRADELSSGIVSQILGAIDNINKEIALGKTYIAVLDSNNQKSIDMASSTLTGFDNFDFAYSQMDLSPVLSEVESIRDKHNLSSSVFTDLTNKLNTAKSQYNTMAGKLDEAKSNADSIQTDISGLSTNINADKPNINALKVMDGNIVGSINTIKITNVESIVSPLRTTIKPLTLKKNYLVYTFPTLLVLLIMFVAILMSATSIMREKKSMAYFRNFITPTFDGMFILGQFLTDISIITLQLLIILGVASIFIPGIGWKLYLIAGSVLLLLSSIFILIGLFLGYIFNSEESATTGAISIGMVFLLFSNTILPLETLSGFLRSIVMYNPFVVGVEILKRLVLFESNTSVIHGLVYTLLIWLAVVMILAIIGSYIAKRKGR